MSDFKLDKWIWTDDDFEQMGWHDCWVHAIAFYPPETSHDEYKPGELALDIDYILQWIHPEKGEKSFKFMVSPATLVFEDVFDIEIDSDDGGLEILEVSRDYHQEYQKREFGHWQYDIDGVTGGISLRAVGYKQYIRQTPILGHMSLDLEQRGGICFERGRTDT